MNRLAIAAVVALALVPLSLSAQNMQAPPTAVDDSVIQATQVMLNEQLNARAAALAENVRLKQQIAALNAKIDVLNKEHAHPSESSAK